MKTELEPGPHSRVIGLIEGTEPGPRVIAVGSIHGNEPAGVRALEQIFEKFAGRKMQFRGTLLALRGNLAALNRGVRYIDEDMNRIWFSSIIDDIRRKPSAELASSERREIKNLLYFFDEYLTSHSPYPTILADLHSFSAAGNMFAITAREEEHIKLFNRLHVPLVFGIEKTLRGAALHYYQEQDCITFALEGGPHQRAATTQNIAASMLAMLSEIGCLDDIKLHSPNRYGKYLAEHNKRMPAQVELVYQHLIEPGDNFKMRPGYENFQRIEKGDWLASDKNGKIYAQCDGYLLMPLYQKQGKDGFFVVSEV